MNECTHNGHLVDATQALPSEPTDFAVDGLPIVGCTRIRCRRCGAEVRSVSEVELARRNPLTTDEIATIYALSDPMASPLLRRADTSTRLYLCRCESWIELSDHRLWDPDPSESDPQLPWRCQGHPTISLPY